MLDGGREEFLCLGIMPWGKVLESMAKYLSLEGDGGVDGHVDVLGRPVPVGRGGRYPVHVGLERV